jgi:hypothetical protein
MYSAVLSQAIGLLAVLVSRSTSQLHDDYNQQGHMMIQWLSPKEEGVATMYIRNTGRLSTRRMGRYLRARGSNRVSEL